MTEQEYYKTVLQEINNKQFQYLCPYCGKYEQIDASLIKSISNTLNSRINNNWFNIINNRQVLQGIQYCRHCKQDYLVGVMYYDDLIRKYQDSYWINIVSL